MALSLYGIFGNPLTHSLSPAMQERAFSCLGIQARYLVLSLEKKRFLSVLSKAERLPLKGFNVTIPYKETVLSSLDHVSTEASRIGAVNTVYRQGKRWVGTNTDVFGFLESLRRDAHFLPRGKSAVVLGAGGAARAAVYGLASAEVREISVFNRDQQRAKRLVRSFHKFFPKTELKAGGLGDGGISNAVFSADLVVNATSIGLKAGEGLPVSERLIPRVSRKVSKKLFYDLIYSPAETVFLETAKRRGHAVLNGAGMLVYQGAKAFEYWTGRKAPVSEMRDALMEALRQRELQQKAAA